MTEWVTGLVGGWPGGLLGGEVLSVVWIGSRDCYVRKFIKSHSSSHEEICFS